MARSSARSPRGTRSRRGATSVKVDLSNIGKAFEAGKDYHIKVVECTLEEGDKAPYFNLKLAGVDPDYTTSYMYHRASTSESSLWRLRPLLEAFGMDIPDGPMDLSAEDFLDCEAMVTTYLERWDGGSSVKPEDFYPVDGAADEEEEEEKPKRGRKKDEEEEKPKRGRRKASPPEDDEEDEEEEKPKRGSKASKKPKKLTEEEVQEMNEDDLADLVDQHDLEVDLDEFKTLRKKRQAVLEALEENDLLDD